jgi:hypothetical protein
VGTGFLIGPSVVLTNYHVVEHMLGPNTDPDGPFPSRTVDDALTCHFDFSATTGRHGSRESEYLADEDWCLGFRRYGLKEPQNAPKFWWKEDKIRNAWLEALGDDLDYAVLRIAGAPGLQRGWYDLTELDDLAASLGCWTFHHPNGDMLKITGGTVHNSNFNAARVFHDASTLPGSSGGLVVNQFGRPIALHHAGHGLNVHNNNAQRQNLRPWDDYINCAIPLRRIVKRLRSDGILDKLEAFAELAPYTGQIERGHPVFGRTDFFRQLRGFAAPTAQVGTRRNVMMIYPEPAIDPEKRPGKSFSVRIIKDLFGGGRHVHVELGPRERKLEARDLARTLLDQLDPERAAALETTLDTTGPAFAAALATDVKRVLGLPRYAHSTVWVHLDELEHANVPDSSGREFLASLYACAGEVDNLRVVLIGLDPRTPIGGLRPRDVVRCAIPFSELDELERTLRDWVRIRSRGGIYDGPALDLLLGAIASYAKDGPSFERAAEFARDHLGDALARGVGVGE